MLGDSQSPDDPANNHCSNCGNLLEEHAQFCPSCGTQRAAATISVAAGFRPPDFGIRSVFGPKSLGELFIDFFRMYGRNFLAILTIVAVVQIPISLAGSWVGIKFEAAIGDTFGPLDDLFASGPYVGSGGDAELVWQIFRPLLPMLILLSIANWIGSLLMTGALIHTISRRLIGGPIKLREAYSFVNF